MTALCLLLAVVAFVLFGLATDHHHQQRLGQRLTPGRKRHLRRLAWVGVGACLAAAFAAQGPVYGAIAGLGALSFGAGAVFLFLNLAPAGGPDTKGKPK
jgi:4-amino-4-deoxy-L-arabinose transferase-like glycosyltransferase